METEAWFLAGALPANAHVMSLLMEEPTAALSSLSSLDVQLLGIARRRGSRARALCKIRYTKKKKITHRAPSAAALRLHSQAVLHHARVYHAVPVTSLSVAGTLVDCMAHA